MEIFSRLDGSWLLGSALVGIALFVAVIAGTTSIAKQIVLDVSVKTADRNLPSFVSFLNKAIPIVALFYTVWASATLVIPKLDSAYVLGQGILDVQAMATVSLAKAIFVSPLLVVLSFIVCSTLLVFASRERRALLSALMMTAGRIGRVYAFTYGWLAVLLTVGIIEARLQSANSTLSQAVALVLAFGAGGAMSAGSIAGLIVWVKAARTGFGAANSHALLTPTMSIFLTAVSVAPSIISKLTVNSSATHGFTATDIVLLALIPSVSIALATFEIAWKCFTGNGSFRHPDLSDAC